MKSNSWRDLLSGKNSLDLSPYIFYAPISILYYPLTNGEPSDLRYFLIYLLISVLSYTCLIISVKVLQRFWIRQAGYSPNPIWLIFVIGAILGAVRGGLNYEVTSFLLLPMSTSNPPLLQILLATLSWAVITPVFAIISNYFEEIKRRRLITMENLVLQESLKISNEEALVRIKDVTRSAIEDDVSALLSEVRIQIASAKDLSMEDQFLKIATILTTASDDLIRPMSHRLMSEHREAFPSPSLWRIFMIAIKSPILPIVPTLAITAFASISVVLSNTTSIIEVLQLTLIQNSLTLLTVFGITIFTRHFKGMGVAAIFFGSLFNVILNNILVGVLLTFEYEFLQPHRTFFHFLWFITVFSIGSLLSTLKRNESSIETFVLQMIENKVIDQSLLQDEILRVKYDIARYLHGNLQSRLMSLGLTSSMVEDKNQSAMDHLLTLSESLLDSPFSQYLSTADRTLIEEVAFHSLQWDGLLTVRSKLVGVESILSVIQVRAVGAALEEALANSLRHGFAKEVDIDIYRGDMGVVIKVTDDGIGPRQNTPGLGSRLYDLIAVNGWSLQHRFDGEGTVLELKL